MSANDKEKDMRKPAWCAVIEKVDTHGEVQGLAKETIVDIGNWEGCQRSRRVFEGTRDRTLNKLRANGSGSTIQARVLNSTRYEVREIEVVVK